MQKLNIPKEFWIEKPQTCHQQQENIFNQDNENFKLILNLIEN
jgi:hypothetical protein